MQMEITELKKVAMGLVEVGQQVQLQRGSANRHPIYNTDLPDSNNNNCDEDGFPVTFSLNLEEELMEIDTEHKNPLHLPEILSKVFQYLDGHQLYTCRLVNRVWNGFAIDAVSKYHPPHLKLSESKDVQVLIEDLQKLRSILKDSDAHSVLLQKLTSPRSLLSNEDCQEFLKEFGWMLKFLEISPCDIQFSLVRSILVDWCPKLEELSLKGLDCQVEDANLDSETFENFGQPENNLRLKRISFSSNATRPNPVLDIDMLMWIVKASSNLKLLRSNGYNSLPRNFFTELKNLPRVTRSLEELWIGSNYNAKGNNDNTLKMLLDMKVQSKFKSVTSTRFNNASGGCFNFAKISWLGKGVAAGYHRKMVSTDMPNLTVFVHSSLL